jgi:multidrug resistance efflux pump
MNEAVGINDRAKATVLAARKAQIEADLSLVEDQLRRIDLRAPFDAVVVAGDKTQSIGAPMRRGDPLYELSPLGSFRVVLDVPQADFARIVPGQPGRLLLSALPYQTHDLTVARMTPIAVAHDGKTVLRAEADMLQADDLLRPGMQGLADIDVGRARLGWLLTHRIIDWVRIKLWVWLP